MRRIRLLQFVAALLLFLGGVLLGRMYTTWERERDAEESAQTPEPVVLSEVADMPLRDVTGADVEGLPRYPGAVRVEYRNVIVGEWEETEVEYVVATDLEAVHSFYRRIFDEEGWTVADLGIYQGEWTFFVVSGEREAIVELEVRQSLVEVEIEVTEPAEP